MSAFYSRKAVVTTLVVLLAGAAGSGIYFNMSAVAANEAPAMQAMPVQTEIVKVQAVQIWKEFSGRLQAVDYALIKPQVSGRIVEIRFKDGQVVSKGDILYVIDPRTYQAAVDQAKADLSAAQNQYDLAQKDLVRARELVKSEAISQGLFDERFSSLNVAKANVAAAKAKLETANINLDFAYVKAPISGRVSRAEITVGNLVESGSNAPLLTSIVSDQGIYADFEVNEQTYLEHVHNEAQNLSEEGKIPVRIVLGKDGSEFNGYIQSFDNHIDTASGTIRARALIDNSAGKLLPGMFVSVKMGSTDSPQQILLSEKAIGTDQDRKFVFVVNKDSKTEYRNVTLGDSYDGKRVILTGLSEGDQIITEGLIRIRPDMPVAPMPAQESQVAPVASAEHDAAKVEQK